MQSSLLVLAQGYAIIETIDNKSQKLSIIITFRCFSICRLLLIVFLRGRYFNCLEKNFFAEKKTYVNLRLPLGYLRLVSFP